MAPPSDGEVAPSSEVSVPSPPSASNGIYVIPDYGGLPRPQVLVVPYVSYPQQQTTFVPYGSGFFEPPPEYNSWVRHASATPIATPIATAAASDAGACTCGTCCGVDPVTFTYPGMPIEYGYSQFQGIARGNGYAFTQQRQRVEVRTTLLCQRASFFLSVRPIWQYLALH
jgi:hypothetical protein